MSYKNIGSFPLAARFKAWVFSCSLADAVGLNLPGIIDTCFLCVICLRMADNPSPRVLQILMCVTECDLETSTIRKSRSTGFVKP